MASRLGLNMAAPLLIAGATILYACGSSNTPLDTFVPDGGPGGEGGNGSGSGASSGTNGGSGSSTGSGGGSNGGSGSNGGGSNSGSSGTASSSGGGNGSSGSGSGGGTSSGTGSGGSSSSGSSGTGSSGGVRDAGPNNATSVLQHHTNASRDGVYPSLLTKTTAATIKLDTSFAPTISGNVYAQPLYVTNGPGGNEAFIVATESNHVTAVSGTGTVLWDKTFGTPASTTGTGALPCGNINPLGITGTPAIDLPSRTIFFDAMTNVSGTLSHMIHAISLDDGTEKTGWPVDVNTAVSGFVSSVQNQRGAVALVGGVVYVPYGGHLGDCGAYHGYVVGVPIASPATVMSWSNSGIGMTPAFKGGIWAAGGISSDGTSLFVSTGNTSTNNGSNNAGIFTAPGSWSGGEAVFKFSSGPSFSNSIADYFYPTNWSALDAADADLGGANPVVIDVGTTHYIAAPGKDGNLYLLNRDNLGGMGAQLSITSIASGAIIGAPAAYTTASGTYVAFRGPTRGCPAGQTGGNLGVVKIAPGTPAMAWCATQSLGSPMVTNGGTGNVIVWDANQRLYGFDGDTGTPVFNGGATSDAMANQMQYMNTPIGAGNRMVVATPNHLYVFHP